MPVLLVKVRAQNSFRLAENILHLLREELRRKDNVVIADVLTNLRLLPELKWAALGDLYRLPDKERYPLKEWEEAVSYLLGCEVHFENYEAIGKNLKPFSLQVR